MSDSEESEYAEQDVVGPVDEPRVETSDESDSDEMHFDDILNESISTEFAKLRAVNWQKSRYTATKLTFNFETLELIPELWTIVKEYIQPELEIVKLNIGIELIGDGFIDLKIFEKLPEWLKYTPFSRKWIYKDKEVFYECNPKSFGDYKKQLKLPEEKYIARTINSPYALLEFINDYVIEDITWSNCESCGYNFYDDTPKTHMFMQLTDWLIHDQSLDIKTDHPVCYLCSSCAPKSGNVLHIGDYGMSRRNNLRYARAILESKRYKYDKIESEELSGNGIYLIIETKQPDIPLFIYREVKKGRDYIYGSTGSLTFMLEKDDLLVSDNRRAITYSFKCPFTDEDLSELSKSKNKKK